MFILLNWFQEIRPQCLSSTDKQLSATHQNSLLIFTAQLYCDAMAYISWGWLKLACNCEHRIYVKIFYNSFRSVCTNFASKLCSWQPFPLPTKKKKKTPPQSFFQQVNCLGFFPLRRPLHSLGRLKQAACSNTCLGSLFLSLADNKPMFHSFFNAQEANTAFVKWLLICKEHRELYCETTCSKPEFCWPCEK